MQWRNLINNTDKYASYSYEPAGRTVVDQFVHRNKNTNETFIKPIGNDYRHQEAENSTLFLNNFQLKKWLTTYILYGFNLYFVWLHLMYHKR